MEMMEVQELPSSNYETGSLTQHSPHESRFIGSSSGIHFIKTVHQAFESSGQQVGSNSVPSAEDTVGGEDDEFLDHSQGFPERGQGFEIAISSQGMIEVANSVQLGKLPTYENAQLLAIEYFKTWHPLLPFLSGPDFLEELEALYRDPKAINGPGRVSVGRRRFCYLIIFQCILCMGASNVSESSECNAPLRSNLWSLIVALASRHDTLTIQTILAAQLFCVSTMALRTASSIGGFLSKLLFHAGLHRCPYRYPQLSNESRDLRKRILWSAYALERYLCQTLGIPVSLTDSEIDVCVPGRTEIHGGDFMHARSSTNSEALNESSQEAAFEKEIILSNLVEHGRLIGRALDIFHVSIHVRAHDPPKVLLLRSDIDKWFNNLPEEPKSANSVAGEQQIPRFLPFFHVLYEQLVISINRPSLSLPRSAPEFHHGIQVTIRASKRTIIAMESQTKLFWPGYLAAIWMSGLIISFACQVGLYNVGQGSQEIFRCLNLLKRMARRWNSAQRCHAVLSILLSNLQHEQGRNRTETSGDDDAESQPTKKRRMDVADFTYSGASVSPAMQEEMPPVTQASAIDNHYNAEPMPFFSENGTEWDVNDFFQDLSWNHLFDINDLGQEPDLSPYSG